MKKVLLTKSQQMIRLTTSDIKMKPQIVVPTNVITDTYMQRKFYQSTYEDIFKLLMRLPDKALQHRVINAINGSSSDKSVITNPNQCTYCSKNEEKPQKVNASTQTEILETKETRNESTVNNEINIKVDVKTESPLKKNAPPHHPHPQLRS